jgi:hypothetical protein
MPLEYLLRNEERWTEYYRPKVIIQKENSNMSVKAYWSIWGLFAIATLLLFATGNLTMLMIVVMGSVGFGLTFMGMMNVLPLLVSHATVAKPAEIQSVALQPMRETPAKAFGMLKSA